MMKISEKTDSSYLEKAQRWIALLVSVIGLILSFYQLIQYFREDGATINWVLISLGAVFLPVILIHIGFSKILVKSQIHTLKPAVLREFRYKKYYKTARFSLIFYLIIVVFSGVILNYRYKALNEKTIILLTNISGPDEKSYQVTYEIQKALKEQLISNKIVVVLREDITITETDGRLEAEKQGRRYYADWVVWGWYGATATDSLITLHLENLTPLNLPPISKTASTEVRANIAELNTFTIQQKTGEGLGGLVLFIDGLVKYNEGKYNEALELLKHAEESTLWLNDLVGKEYLYLYIGNIYFWQGKNLEAISSYSNAIDANPDFGEAYYNRGMVYFYSIQYDEAVSDYSAALGRNPAFYCEYCSYLHRGISYFMLGEFEKSISDFTEALTLNSNQVRIYSMRADSYYELGNYENSIEDLNRYIEIYPEDYLAFFKRGNANYYLGEYKEAIKDFSTSIILSNDNYSTAYFRRGDAYSKVGNHEKAVVDYSAGILIQPDSAPAYNNRGIEYEALGETDLALSDYSHAIEIDPQDYQAYYNRARLHYSLEEYEEAIADFEVVINNGKDELNVSCSLFYQATSFYILGNYDEALTSYDNYLRLPLTCGVTCGYLGRGEVYYALGKYEDARVEYQLALDSCGERKDLCEIAKGHLKDIPAK